MARKPVEKQKLKLTTVPVELPKVFKKICCPSCTDEVPADNININDKIAKCNHCDVVFPFHQDITDFQDTTKIRQEVIRPEGIDVFHFQDELEISVRQPGTAFVLDYLGVTLFPLFAFLMTMIFFDGGKVALAVPLILWALTGLSSIRLFNRSKYKIHLTIDQQDLHVYWRPKNFHKDKSYAVADIDQVYIKSIDGHNFGVFMIVNGIDGQKHVTLVQYAGSRSKAQYLEQEIESHLGITDRRVPEETV